MSNTRQQELLQWIENQLGSKQIVLTPLQGDASLRKFYRLNTSPSTILMDAAADLKNQEFLNATKLLQAHGLKTPKIFLHNVQLGLFQVEDFGDNLLFNHIEHLSIEDFLKQAIDMIIKIQKIPVAEMINPISFDATFIDRELNLFTEWFVDKYLELKLTVSQKTVVEETFVFIKEMLLSQPYLCMHRDFHSKNIMILPDESLGLLDFQDLMLGPVTYDLMSLLKDCYVTWPEDVIQNLLVYYYQAFGKNLNFNDFADFVFYFDITGLQRHLKVVGGFSKIYFTRNNAHYLQYFDRILDYIVRVTAKYSQLEKFYRMFTFEMIPRLFN